MKKNKKKKLNGDKADVKRGCRVEVSLMDGEEGFGYTQKGEVIFDYEEMYYQRNVDVKLDNGRTLSRVPKWLCKRLKGNLA